MNFKELFYENTSKSSEFKLILDNGDVITYYDNGKDWMRSYGDKKPLQAFDSKMWNKEKIIKRESKHYKIKKIVD